MIAVGRAPGHCQGDSPERGAGLDRVRGLQIVGKRLRLLHHESRGKGDDGGTGHDRPPALEDEGALGSASAHDYEQERHDRR